jgi:hypothetical protein
MEAAMWIIQRDTLMSIPDDAPLPPESLEVQLPKDFLDSPEGYVVKDGKLIKSKRKPTRPKGLTAEDIAKIKAAIKAGTL